MSRRTRPSIFGSVLVVLVACAPALPEGTGRAHDPYDPEPGGPSPGPRPAPGAAETCGNDVDDDLDKSVDEGCACPRAGDVRDCFAGTAAQRDVGACRSGSQACSTQGEFAAWGSCAGTIGPVDEVPGNGVDDDCNGAVDNPAPPPPTSDGGVPPAPTGTCPPGQGLRFQPSASDVPGFDGTCASAVIRERSAVGLSCGPTSCAAGLVEIAGFEAGWGPGAGACVPVPTCAPGLTPRWADDGSGGHWNCDPACPDLTIQYGFMFQCERVCAPTPTLECFGGETPTWVFETRQWECRPMCDGDRYDPVYLDGTMVIDFDPFGPPRPSPSGAPLVCVPC